MIDGMIDSVVNKIASGEISTVAAFRAATVEFPLETLAKVLFESAIHAPEQRVLIRTLFEEWHAKQYPKQVQVTAQPAAAVCRHSMAFGVDDLIFLTARLDDARSRLKRFGSWWRVRSGYLQGKGYLLESIYCKGKTQSRTEPKQKVELLVIGREGDNNYDVTNVIPFPCSVDQIP